jgi:hypothetical protein
MIRLVCDNCEKPLDVGDELAGQKVKCPACGDVNIVPVPSVGAAPQPPTDKSDRAASAGYPPAAGDEVTVLRVRRAMFRAKPIRYMLLLLGMLGGFGTALFFMLLMNPVSWTGAAIAGIIGLACAVTLGIWKIITLGETLAISNKRTIERNGILSKRTTEVRHRDIRNIQIHQTFAQRMFNVGRLGISSSGQDEIEIVVDDLPDPQKIRRIIDLYRPM